jgi:excisionase family DNA binding protein
VGSTRSSSIEDLAEYLGVPVTTIFDWRVDGKGPCGVCVGRHVKFIQSDVLAWIETQREVRPGGRRDGRWPEMGRPRTAIGTFGEFTYVTASNGRIKARVRFRDDDGQLRLVQATGSTRTRRRLRRPAHHHPSLQDR